MSPPQNVVPSGPIASAITLGDIGFGDGLRFSHLGGRRDLYIPLPEGSDVVPTELVLTVDDISAHPARRTLEVLVNDYSVAALPLDGRSMARIIRIALAGSHAREGYLKLTFIYSGAASEDRCIDARYVGDSLTIRPESAVEFEIAASGTLDVATTLALMPREVAVVMAPGRLAASDLAAGLAVARGLAASGRQVTFAHDGASLAEWMRRRAEPRRWARGVIMIGPIDEFLAQIDRPAVTVASLDAGLSTIMGVRVAGFPALLISDSAAVQAGRLLGGPALAAARGLTTASIGESIRPVPATDRISFDQLGVTPGLAEVAGRTDFSIRISRNALPPGTSMARLLLDILVAPDGSGDKAVVSVLVNERLLGSTAATGGEATRLDVALPDGLLGNAATIRAMVQRRTQQGDCRFEPQGYPAQILGSSAIVLARAKSWRDFSDLSPHWAAGVEILLPEAAAERPLGYAGLLANVLTMLSPKSGPVTVKFVPAGTRAKPSGPFLAVADSAPQGVVPRAHFDRGRIEITDQRGRTLLDLGAFTTGAVAQLVTAGEQPGLWIRPLAADGSLPNPAHLRLDRGDVAVLDSVGTSLAMSTERDTLVKIAYPDRTSWLTMAGRSRPWILGAVWLLATVLFLLFLQRIYRRRARAGGD